MPALLFKLPHGLGDVVQFSVVLKHLARYRPGWTVDVRCGKGKHTALIGLCNRVWHDGEPDPAGPYDNVVQLGWYENYCRYPDRPNSKITNCLKECFGIDWASDLARYEVKPSAEAWERAEAYLGRIGATLTGNRYNAVVFHYEGNTSPEKKNLAHWQVEHPIGLALDCGRVPIVLDWDRRSTLPDNDRIWNPGGGHSLWGSAGIGDAGVIAALISLSEAFVGIDSGPGKLASATDTPSLICWRKHHPIQFHDPAANTTHLVPIDHAEMSPCGSDIPQIAQFFVEHYSYRVYADGDKGLAAAVLSWLAERLDTPATKVAIHMGRSQIMHELTTTVYGERYYQEHKRDGLDYLAYGDWHVDYGRWLIEALGWKEKRVLDVGCACGAIVRGLAEAGAVVQGVDVNEYTIRLGRGKWPGMAHLLFTCDAVNLHLYADGAWQGIHSQQVAEHWKPALVPHILTELRRITAPGGLFFCCLDTVELFERQGRTLDREDPTHICVRPIAWWHERLAECGWEAITREIEPTLRGGELSFFRRYDWDFFVARRL